MKKEINVCDICSEKIAKHKCEICEKDLCDDCIKEEKVFIVHNDIDIELCEKCMNTKLDKEVLDKIKKWVLKDLKDGKIFKGLSDEEEELRTIITTPLTTAKTNTRYRRRIKL